MKGHLRKRSENGKWYCVYDVPSSDGKRKQKWTPAYYDRKKSEDLLTKLVNEINEGIYIEPSKETIADFMKTWLQVKKTKVRPTTWETYKNYTKNHIIPGIGHYHLDKLNTTHLELFYDKLLKKLSPKSISKVHEIIRNALGYAKKNHFVRENVASTAETPSINRRKMAVWNEEQVNRFLQIAAEDRLYIAFYLALMTGMRKGEILGLRWRDIDPKNKMLSVNQTLSNTGAEFQPAKTEGSHRSIALSKKTLEQLKQHRAMINEEKMRAGENYNRILDLVVCTKLGTKVLPRNLGRIWYRLLKASDLPEIRFHDLRHTHATLMLKQGIHPKIVSERLGHSSVQITLDTYSHILPGLQEAAAAKFDENLFGEDPNKKDQKE